MSQRRTVSYQKEYESAVNDFKPPVRFIKKQRLPLPVVGVKRTCMQVSEAMDEEIRMRDALMEN
jgi:hypothetical protein